MFYSFDNAADGAVFFDPKLFLDLLQGGLPHTSCEVNDNIPHKRPCTNTQGISITETGQTFKKIFLSGILSLLWFQIGLKPTFYFYDIMRKCRYVNVGEVSVWVKGAKAIVYAPMQVEGKSVSNRFHVSRENGTWLF